MIDVTYVPTSDMIADGLTKPLTHANCMDLFNKWAWRQKGGNFSKEPFVQKRNEKIELLARAISEDTRLNAKSLINILLDARYK